MIILTNLWRFRLTWCIWTPIYSHIPEKISSLDLKLFKSLTNLTNIQDSLMKRTLVVFVKNGWLRQPWGKRRCPNIQIHRDFPRVFSHAFSTKHFLSSGRNLISNPFSPFVEFTFSELHFLAIFYQRGDLKNGISARSYIDLLDISLGPSPRKYPENLEKSQEKIPFLGIFESEHIRK